METVVNSPLLTDKDAAAYLGLRNVGTLAVWRSTKRYPIPFIRIGRSIRYRREELDKFLASRAVTPSALALA